MLPPFKNDIFVIVYSKLQMATLWIAIHINFYICQIQLFNCFNVEQIENLTHCSWPGRSCTVCGAGKLFQASRVFLGVNGISLAGIPHPYA